MYVSLLFIRSRHVVLLLCPDICSVCRARFMTCLSTLRFLGYIKETGRKQDHVAKATHEG